LNADWINGALDGVGEPGDYFRRTDLARLREKILGAYAPSCGSL
jgi:hypothetical protein